MERRKNEVRVKLLSPEAIRRARVINDVVLGKRLAWPNTRTAPEDIESQILSPQASINFLQAIDRVARGQVPIDQQVKGWAIYMQNHYGRYPSRDLDQD